MNQTHETKVFSSNQIQQEKHSKWFQKQTLVPSDNSDSVVQN